MYTKAASPNDALLLCGTNRTAFCRGLNFKTGILFPILDFYPIHHICGILYRAESNTIHL